MKEGISSLFRGPVRSVFFAVVFLLGSSLYYSLSSADKSDRVGKTEVPPTKGTQVDTTSVRSKPGEYLPVPDEFVPYDELPKFVKRVAPKYPPQARESGISGTVWVQVLVDKKGKVADARIYKDSGNRVGLEEAAIEAAKASEFAPVISNNQPIAVWIIYPYNFVTKDKPGRPDETSTRQTKTTQGTGTTAGKAESPPAKTTQKEMPPAKEMLPADTISIKDKPEDHVPAASEFVPYDVPPKFVKRVEPKYPSLAKLSGITGKVLVQVLVDKNGKVADVRIYKDSGTNAGLEQAAIEAARQSEFSPAISKGQPIAVWIIYHYDFTLKNK
jgi:TonB family protein